MLMVCIIDKALNVEKMDEECRSFMALLHSNNSKYWGPIFLIKLKFEVKGQRCAMVGAGFYSLYFICDSFISFMISIFIHGINAVYLK